MPCSIWRLNFFLKDEFGDSSMVGEPAAPGQRKFCELAREGASIMLVRGPNFAHPSSNNHMYCSTARDRRAEIQIGSTVHRPRVYDVFLTSSTVKLIKLSNRHVTTKVETARHVLSQSGPHPITFGLCASASITLCGSLTTRRHSAQSRSATQKRAYM